ncbi:MAG: response regulator [Cyclobacteriaceae bacterium]
MYTINFSTVLVVEDDVIAQMTLNDMLTEMGFSEVNITSSKKEALSIIDNKSIDVVLLDVFIDGSRQGIEIAKRINKKSNVPILFLTGSSDEETVQGISQTVNRGVLEKPYDFDIIQEKLQSTLGQHN